MEEQRHRAEPPRYRPELRGIERPTRAAAVPGPLLVWPAPGVRLAMRECSRPGTEACDTEASWQNCSPLRNPQIKLR